MLRSVMSLRLPRRTERASIFASIPRPGIENERLRLGEIESLLTGGAYYRFGQWVLGVLLGGRSEAKKLIARDRRTVYGQAVRPVRHQLALAGPPGRRNDVRQRRLALGQRAGLVEDDDTSL